MKSIHRTFALLSLALLAGLTLFAPTAARAQINYQGRLTDAAGAALPAGQYSLQFSLWTTATGGASATWGPFNTDGLSGNGHGPLADVVTDGRFNVIINNLDTTARSLTTAMAASTSAYLEIKVGTNAAITPRQIILAAPRALSADVIPKVTPNASGVAISGNATISGALSAASVSATGNLSTPAIVIGGTLANSNSSYQFANGVNVGSGGINLPGAFNGNANPAFVGNAGNFLSFAHGGASEDSLSYKNNTFYFRDTPDGGDTSDPNIDIGGGAFFGTSGRFSNNVSVGSANAPTKAKLEVTGNVFNLAKGGNKGWLDYDGVETSSGGGSEPTSIFASDSIWAGNQVIASSDERIKNIAGRSDAARDLRTLLGIEVTDYRLKDVIAKGNAPQKKVIAQQVEKVFPQAVSKHTDVVPDLYQTAPIQDGWVKLATDLKVGDRVKLIDAKNTESIQKVLETKEGRFRTALQPEGDQIFVYGREVQDFRTVDYDAIAMLNVSATQELARKLEAKDADFTKLSRENTALASKVAALEARDAAREARLARLETALDAQSARSVRASLERK
jgi:hypothetical protein